MCTVSFNYNARSARARRKVAEMRKSGLFEETGIVRHMGKTEHHPSEETEAFIFTSRHNAAKMFASQL